MHLEDIPSCLPRTLLNCMRGGADKHFGCALAKDCSIQVSNSVAVYCLPPKSALQIITRKFSPELIALGNSGDSLRYCQK